MDLIKEIKPYQDHDGLVAPGKADPLLPNASGNGVLYTSQFMVLLRLAQGYMKYEDTLYYRNLMVACMKGQLGRLNRSPSHPDQEGPDDYIGLAAGSVAAECQDLSQYVLEYGNSHFWFFNNANPGSLHHKDGRFNWSAALWRQPQLIALYHHASGNKPNHLLRIIMALTIAVSGLNKHTVDLDSRIMADLMLRCINKPNWYERLAIKIFSKRLYSHYRLGMQTIYETAFPKEHPLHKYSFLLRLMYDIPSA